MSIHQPDDQYKGTVEKYGYDKVFTNAQFRVNRAIEISKRILINHKVQNFSAADVTATAALILQEENKEQIPD